MTRGPVHLGDLLTAARVLRMESPEGLRALARTLGLPLPDGAPPAEALPRGPAGERLPGGSATGSPPGAGSRPRHDSDRHSPDRHNPDRRDTGGQRRAARRPAAGAAAPGRGGPPGSTVPPGSGLPPDEDGTAGPPASAGGPSTGSLTTLRGPDPSRRPRTAADPAPLPLLERHQPPAHRPPPPWDPRTQRGVMLAAASTDVEGREVDRHALVGMAVRALAGREPRRGMRTPRRIRPTTREGALVLLDRGTAMQPYRHDQAWLAELAELVLRHDRVQVRDLLLRRGVSSDGGRTWEALPPPVPGRPVLLLSDLGALAVPFADRTATTPMEWLPWLRRLRRGGAPVTCLTPFPATAYPQPIRRAVPLVPLDRRTSIRFTHAETRRFRDRGPRG
ncbi:hypothetical protein [Peterkaempfera sp. SMS 1(5)a]|uniref:hypothetical protein n=1 Tax=Peterkaempfera podocarpi TaxID=3232308 RepID=UPI00366DEE36